MAERFDIEGRWPELFAGLDDVERDAVVQTFASAWHEGWVPNREDVKDLTDLARGVIDHAEYERRTKELVARDKAAKAQVTAG